MIEHKEKGDRSMNNTLFKIFIAGDSTAADYPEAQRPMAGWGQMLPRFFTKDVRVENHASCGRSTVSFIRENRLDRILESIRSNDYLLIQFGHNDEKTDDRFTDPHGTYKMYLKMYVDGARERGALPVLITPVNRRRFDSHGEFYLTHGEYPAAMISLAQELGVPMVDLEKRSRDYFAKLGEEATKKLFMHMEPGESINYPEGVHDDTHFSEQGALVVAKLVVDGLRALELPWVSTDSMAQRALNTFVCLDLIGEALPDTAQSSGE